MHCCDNACSLHPAAHMLMPNTAGVRCALQCLLRRVTGAHTYSCCPAALLLSLLLSWVLQTRTADLCRKLYLTVPPAVLYCTVPPAMLYCTVPPAMLYCTAPLVSHINRPSSSSAALCAVQAPGSCFLPVPPLCITGAHRTAPTNSAALRACLAGPSLRMFDAAAGWVVKRVRSRHMQAPSSPTQLAAVADVFARLQHKSVVVPELLNALGSQVGVLRCNVSVASAIAEAEAEAAPAPAAPTAPAAAAAAAAAAGWHAGWPC
jgi:hypothetical protein